MGRLTAIKKQAEPRILSTNIEGELLLKVEALVDDLDQRANTEKCNINRLLKELLILAISDKTLKKQLITAIKKRY